MRPARIWAEAVRRPAMICISSEPKLEERTDPAIAKGVEGTILSMDVGVAPPTGVVAWIQRNVAPIYDRVNRAYEGETARRVLTFLVIALFLIGLLISDMIQRGFLFEKRPVSHFVAVEAVFTWLLVVEIVGLVLGIVGSVANAMGKQLEILSLILLRDAFKQFREFGEPIEWAHVEPYIVQMLADLGGGLLLFVILGIYYRIQPHRPFTQNAGALGSFVAIKKLVALALLGVFVLAGLSDLVRMAVGLPTFPFFETFYTILIFADILVVLISLRYTKTYAVIFRNSGYTLTTVLIRIALTAPGVLHVFIGVTAGLLALGLSLAYRFFPIISDETDYAAPTRA